MARRSRWIALAAAVLLVPTTPAQAQDPDASTPPTVSGPLIGSPLGCEDNGDAGPNEIRFQACGWFYELAPAETNATEDFSAVWVQMDATVGSDSMCVKKFTFKVHKPDGARVVSGSPEKGTRRIGKRTHEVASLTVDGDGAAPLPGTIEHDTVISKGRITVRRTDTSYIYQWRGNASEKIVIAIGVQLAHAGLPPDYRYSVSEVIGVEMGSCEPIYVTVDTTEPRP